MNTAIRIPLLGLLLGACASVAAQDSSTPTTNFGAQEPSVESIVEQLRSKPEPGVQGVRTRALRPGAAAAATNAPAPAKASISMQVQFGFNSTQLEGGSVRSMENLAAALASPELQDRNFTIVGHTDGVGAAGYNQHLSEQRARAVKAFLTQRGVPAARLETQGKGFANLLNPADPRAAENRRVEIVAATR